MHDFENSRFYGVNGKIDLTNMENRLLDLLIRNKGHIVTYKAIVKEIYKSKEEILYRRVIGQHIFRLRKKLKDDVSIKIRKNYGYFIEI